MDTIESGLSTADLPADMQAPSLRTRVETTVSIMALHLMCEHGWYGCEECPDPILGAR